MILLSNLYLIATYYSGEVMGVLCMKFAGVVTLYHPVIEDIINNIQSYLDELDILYVLDKSWRMARSL